MEPSSAPTILIELYGVPRLKAGQSRISVEAQTLSAALQGLAERFPSFAGSVVQEGGRLHPAYRVSLNSDRFLTDPETPLSRDDVLLLFAADVGG